MVGKYLSFFKKKQIQISKKKKIQLAAASDKSAPVKTYRSLHANFEIS